MKSGDRPADLAEMERRLREGQMMTLKAGALVRVFSYVYTLEDQLEDAARALAKAIAALDNAKLVVEHVEGMREALEAVASEGERTLAIGEATMQKVYAAVQWTR